MRYATPFMLALTLAACSSQATINQALVSADGRTLSLGIAACNADLSADVVYTEAEVRVTVTAENSSADDCLDSMTIELEEAVGGRALVDGSTGRQLATEPMEE